MLSPTPELPRSGFGSKPSLSPTARELKSPGVGVRHPEDPQPPPQLSSSHFHSASVGRLSHYQKWARLPLLLQEAPLCPPLPGPRGRRSCPPPPVPPQLQPPWSFRTEGRPWDPTILMFPRWRLSHSRPSGPVSSPSGPLLFPALIPRPASAPHPPQLSLCSSPPPHPGRCPAPTAARKDAAWVPCQASECAAPPSPARNAAGQRGRHRHSALRPARSHKQSGRWPRIAGAWVSSRRKAGLPALLSKH